MKRGGCGGATFLNTESSQAAELAVVSNEELRKRLLKRYEGWHEPIGTFLANTPGIIKTNIYEIQRLPLWHHDRVVLVGDAAHAMSPSAGQGASVALEDALYLVKLLHQSSGEIETVFGEFERARRPRAEKISGEAHKNETRQRIELGPFGLQATEPDVVGSTSSVWAKES